MYHQYLFEECIIEKYMNEKCRYGLSFIIYHFFLIILMLALRRVLEKTVNQTNIGFNLATDVLMDLFKHAMRKHFNNYYEGKFYKPFFVFSTYNHI